MAKSYVFLALLGLFSTFFVLASCQGTSLGSPVKQVDPVVTCPTTLNCTECVSFGNNSCSMVWNHNGIAACMSSVNVDGTCYSVVANATDCLNMETCINRTTCEVCVPENKQPTSGCTWCITLNRCASNFIHVSEIHDLITDFNACKTIPQTTTPPITTSTATTTTAATNTTTTSTTTTTTTTTTTVAPNTTTSIPPTTTPASNTTTPASNTTTPVPITTPMPSPTPVPHTDRRFDGPSFIGGIVLALGCMAISFVAWKFYKARTEPQGPYIRG